MKGKGLREGIDFRAFIKKLVSGIISNLNKRLRKFLHKQVKNSRTVSVLSLKNKF